MENKLKLYICDDDCFFNDRLKRRIEELTCKSGVWKCEILVFNSGRNLLEECRKAAPDAVFLDIDMPEMDGIEVAEWLVKEGIDTLVVFVTSHDDKVFQVWNVQPFWFVRKAYLDDLGNVMTKLYSAVAAARERKKTVFTLICDSCSLQLDTSSLVYIESIGHDILIKDSKPVDKKVRCRLSDAEEQLYPLHIIRIQNGIIVNLRFVSRVTSRDAYLSNGLTFPIGRDRVDYVKKEFQMFLRSGCRGC